MRGVKSSRALKLLILLAFLSLTLGWKVIARATRDEPPTDRSIQVRVAEFLVRQHFSISMLEHAEEGKPTVTASSGMFTGALLLVMAFVIGPIVLKEKK